MGSKYKCFQFNENSLLQKPIGPAYQPRLEFDMKNDDGSNSKDSVRMKIKVRKIKAVTKLDENTYSDTKDYWYHEKTKTIYDFDLHYLVGKIGVDNNNNPEKISGDVFIISDEIDIPEFKLY